MNRQDSYIPSFLREEPEQKTQLNTPSPALQQDMLFVRQDKTMLVLSRGFFNSAELVNPASTTQTLMFVAGVYVVMVSGSNLAPLLLAYHDRKLIQIEEGKNGVTRIEWERV